MRLLFLDIDGVLVTDYSMGLKPVILDRLVLHRFQNSCVQELNRITNKTGASIVVSSTWRFRPLDLLIRHMRGQGVTGEIIGKTTTVRMARGAQIALWLESNPFPGPEERTTFVILDYDSDMEPHMDRLVQTDPLLGLRRSPADRAIQLLQEG